MIDIKDGNAIILLDLLAAFVARIKERESGLVEIIVKHTPDIDGAPAEVSRLNETVKFPPCLKRWSPTIMRKNTRLIRRLLNSPANIQGRRLDGQEVYPDQTTSFFIPPGGSAFQRCIQEHDYLP
jgi:hypothetical protein